MSEILVSRGLVRRESLEGCASRRGTRGASLVEMLIEEGQVSRAQAEEAAEEARSLEECLAPEFPAGKRLGEFELLRELGRGGMGIVYEAEQEALGRRVALKLLPGAAALDERLAIRFLREARAAGRLKHPGIVSVYTSGRAEGVLYFAMELVEGETLAARIARGPLEPREAAEIASKVARALEHAHASGLVHRDVKPENILLAANGQVKITDFGLVLEAATGPFTLSRHVLGTPSFIAPEQARGESVDARCDVYGLGAVLYAMLAGQPPFAGEVPSLVLARVVSERPQPLAALRPDLPPRLIAVCERAMAPDPAARYPTAGEMGRELEDWLAHGVEGGADATTKASTPARRSWRWVTAAGLIVVAAAAWWVVKGARGGASRSAALEPSAKFEPLASAPGRKKSPALSPDGREIAYSSDADGDWDLYRMTVGGGAPVNLTPDSPFEDGSPAYSPDGRELAYASWLRGGTLIRVIDLATGAARDLVRTNASGLTWSLDGREILFHDHPSDHPSTGSTSAKLFAVEVGTGRVRALTGMHGSGPDPSPVSGEIVFINAGGGRTDVWSLPSNGSDPRPLTDDADLEWSAVWSLDGRHVVFGGESDGVGGVFRIDVGADGHVLGGRTQLAKAIFPAPFYLTRAALSEEVVLVGVQHAGRLYRLGLSDDAEAVESVTAMPSRFLAADSPDASADGERLVFRALTSQEDLAIGPPLDPEPVLLTHDAFRDRDPRWSPDGSRIAFASDREGPMELWSIAPDGSGLRRMCPAIAGVATAPVWSPGGRELVIAFEDGAALLAVAEDGTGELIEKLPEAEGGGRFAPSSWSPDGTQIAGAGDGLLLYSVESREFRRLAPDGRQPVWLDARRLLFTTERELRVLDTRTGRSRTLFTFSPARVSPSIAAGRDGRSVIVSVSLSSEELWRVELRD